VHLFGSKSRRILRGAVEASFSLGLPPLPGDMTEPFRFRLSSAYVNGTWQQYLGKSQQTAKGIIMGGLPDASLLEDRSSIKALTAHFLQLYRRGPGRSYARSPWEARKTSMSVLQRL
jgi:hypothetical protein